MSVVGSGQYDFGESSLNQLSESLLAQKKNKKALAGTQMSFASNHARNPCTMDFEFNRDFSNVTGVNHNDAPFASNDREV